jgi:ABC-type cobalamin/Fe3+-siderophores transport system ATPase subunit
MFLNFSSNNVASKSIILLGPRCSGKSTLLRSFARYLSEYESINLRTSILNSNIYNHKELYGESSGNSEFLSKPILQIILNEFMKQDQENKEKEDENEMEIRLDNNLEDGKFE